MNTVRYAKEISKKGFELAEMIIKINWWNICLAIIIIILFKCGSATNITAKNMVSEVVYEELRNNAIKGNKVKIYYPSGALLAQNVEANLNTDECLLTLFLSSDWLIVGSKNGFSEKILWTDNNWMSKIQSEITKDQKCITPQIATVATKDFNFNRIEELVKILNKERKSLLIYDLKLESRLDTSFKPITIAQMRPISIQSVKKDPKSFENLFFMEKIQIEKYIEHTK